MVLVVGSVPVCNVRGSRAPRREESVVLETLLHISYSKHSPESIIHSLQPQMLDHLPEVVETPILLRLTLLIRGQEPWKTESIL